MTLDLDKKRLKTATQRLKVPSVAIRANAFSGRRIVYSQNKDLVQSGTLFRGRSSIQKNNHEGVTTNCSGS